MIPAGHLVTLWVAGEEGLAAGLNLAAPGSAARLTYGLASVEGTIQNVVSLGPATFQPVAPQPVANPGRVTVASARRDDEHCVHGRPLGGFCEGCQVDFLGEG